MRVPQAALIIILLTTSALSAEQVVHTVSKGDTLYGISRRYSVSIDDLVRANEILEPGRLSVGMRLVIPSGYEVVKGDTLYGIARAYDTTVEEIRELNDLDAEHVLQVGEVILLPRGAEVIAADSESETVGPEIEGTPDMFWPLEGERAEKDGKINGTEIVGVPGDMVYSVSSGVVVWAAPYRGYGKVVIVEAKDSHYYLYGGNDLTYVKPGDRVNVGSKIASLGTNSHTGEARLFFTVFRNGMFLDPAEAPRG